ncbi:hypothetical protein ETD96_18200 [Actinomadura geliboluensis]|uniref:Uncharacterized protein n=1 Tax=Actinomadura geliboluensis TaxID=882440 RepID=A0A5S4HF40_9ACTN|nr:hypothetical protein ETD96_18200 [Actinomadura geliboluensis]
MSQIDLPAVELLRDMACSLNVVIDLEVEELTPGLFAVEVSDPFSSVWGDGDHEVIAMLAFGR